MSVVVSAPGKVLLAGEYAVLDGRPALVVAVSRRAVARIAETPPPGRLSPFLEETRRAVARRFGPRSPEARAAGRVVVDTSALEAGQGTFPGAGVPAEGAPRPKLGLGSSAAATVAAAAAALASFRPLDDALRAEIHAIAHEAHAAAQAPRGARGSGADVAASVRGGLLRYELESGVSPRATPVPWPSGVRMVLVWTGRSADTPSLVARVRAFRERAPSAHATAIARLGDVAEALEAAFRAADPEGIVRGVAAGADAFAALADAAGAPLVPPSFAPVAARAAAAGGAAKPTGAGGGDLLCALFPDADGANRFARDIQAIGMRIVPAEVDPLGVALAAPGVSA